MKFHKANIIVGDSEVPCVIGVWDDMKIPEEERPEGLYIRVEEQMNKDELKNTNLSILFPKAKNTLNYLLEDDEHESIELKPYIDLSFLEDLKGDNP